MSLTDQELIKKIMKGDKTAENELCRRYMKKIYVYVQINLYDSTQIEDIVNDSFIAIIQNIRSGKLQNIEKIPAYIYKISINKCKNANRSKKNKKTQSLEELETFKQPFRESTIQKQIESKEIQKTLKKCMDDLQSIDYNIILDSFFEKKSQKEIAENLDISVELVAVRKFRALEKLRNCLQKKNYSVII